MSLKILIAVSLIINAIGAFPLGANSEPFRQILCTLLAIACSLVMLFQHARHRKSLRIDAVTALFALALITLIPGLAPYHVSGYDGTLHWLRYFSLLTILFIVSQAGSSFSYVILHKTLSLSVVALLIIYLLDSIFGIRFMLADNSQEAGVKITFGNRNFLACYLVACFPILISRLYLPALQVRGKSRLITTSVAIACAYLCVITGSRNGLLGIFIGILFILSTLLLLHGKKFSRNHIVATIAGLVILTLFLWFSVPEHTLNKFTNVLNNDSDLGRVSIWSLIIDHLLESPATLLLGNGIGSLYTWNNIAEGAFNIFGLDQRRHQFAHCEYLDILFEGGLLTTSLILIALAILVIRLAKSIKVTPLSSISFAQVIFVMAIFGLTSVAFRHTEVLMPIGVILAVALRTTAREQTTFPAKYSYPLLLFLLAGNLFALVPTTKRLVSDYHFMNYQLLESASKLLRSSKSIYDLDKTRARIVENKAVKNQGVNSNYAVVRDAAMIQLEKSTGSDLKNAQAYYNYHQLYMNNPDFTVAQKKEVHATMNSIIPNFLNTAETFAHQLHLNGKTLEAVEITRSSMYARTYDLELHSLLLFYLSYSAHKDLPVEICDFIYKIMQIEENSKNGEWLISFIRNTDTITISGKTPEGKKRVVDINCELLADVIYKTSRSGHFQMKTAIINSVAGLMKQIWSVHEPRFLNGNYLL